MLEAGRLIRADDPVLTYRGAVSLQEVDGGILPWRIPFQERHLFFPEGSVGRAAMPSGVRITFRTDAAGFAFRYAARPAHEMPGPPENPQVDVRVDGKPVASLPLVTDQGIHTCHVGSLPGAGAGRLVELWLPCLNQFTLHGVEVPADAEVSADTTSAPRWVHYGSSESQGRGALSPSRNWTATVATELGLDLTSLAIGAGCYLQPLFATLLRDLPADLITCMVGINIYGTRALNQFTYRPNLIGMIRIIRERHPSTPLLIASHHHSPWHDPLKGDGYLSLVEVREQTREVVELLRADGDENLHYVHGPSLAGPETAHLYVEPRHLDPLHFNQEGHDLLAAAFRRKVEELVPGLARV
ncbi:G-D-S-L family lipolytic protein [Streptomyces mobaraensis NBRC 13819 = DSM 40847]|nr:GDSL-type esterase/lipase family protein [Streptomyces mobaraensis]QTT74980.1 G-D-S-L family lipolytic protein [Streptomyces mobaraensis NBRC 13819 = DSM 40847]